MTRIFTTLTALALLLVAANLVVGLPLDVAPETHRWATVHRLGGVAAALAVVLVNSIVVTYFVGTSRWVKEVSETYRLDPKFVADSSRIKRRAFPWATLSMLAVVGLIASGGACDPSTGQPHTGGRKLPHLIAAFAVLGFLAWASVAEWNHIHSNQLVIANVLDEVKRIRDERGLP